MSKYIDLLREHQEKPDKKENSQKDVSAVAADTSPNNPYSKQSEKDKDLLENMESLLDEQNSETQNTASIIDEYDDEELVADEQTPSPTSSSETSNDFGFDIATWLAQLEQTLVLMFGKVKNNEPINIDILNEQLSILFDHVSNNSGTLDALALQASKQRNENKGNDAYMPLAHRGVLMMIYTINIGLQLKLELNKLLPKTVAAMLHHLGEASLPKSASSQTKQYALDYLTSQNIQHAQLQIAIAKGDERYDGSGPEESEGHDIPWIARLIGLLSTFERLIQSGNEQLSPLNAIRLIVQEHKKEFDPEILKALINSVSLYPVGTYVQLNTGEAGEVINVHINSPLRPIVFITMNKAGEKIDERKIDLKKQPTLMIQRSALGGNLEDLVTDKQ